MMEIYAILSGKGGTGKTTLAVHLAVAAERSGQTSVVIDLDPQGSATDWGHSRQAETPVVVAADPARLADILETAEANVVDVAVIDTAPHTDRDVYTQTPAQIAANLASIILQWRGSKPLKKHPIKNPALEDSVIFSVKV